jgi:hypothetical protein
MAFLLSPGVSISEVDLTTVVPSLPTSVGAFAGDFRWGPIEQVSDVSNEVQLVDRFGRPDTNYISFFSAANFLAYSGSLKLVRANAAGMLNAGNGGGILITNDTNFKSVWETTGSGPSAGPLVAKFPGSLGNSIKYSICDANTTAFNSWTYRANFTAVPNTSPYVSTRGGANDEVHIIVIDEGGKLTGTPNTILEKYEFLSRATDAKRDDGSTNFWASVVNGSSRYLRAVGQPKAAQLSGSTGDIFNGLATTGFANSAATFTLRLSGGADGTVVTGNLTNAYSFFSNPDEVDIGLIITGNCDTTVVNYCTTLAEARKDCMVFASPKESDVVNTYGTEVTKIKTTRDSLTSSSYTVMDTGWKYQYDKYNDTYRYIPLNPDIAGLCARVDADRDPWFSPGGLNRGFIKNIVNLPFNPSQSQRDELYVKNINPVVTFTGQGTVLFGDKTLTSRPSSFDRINVRRLFIVLEKAVSTAAKYSLFEFNDTFTRDSFVNLVEPYLRDIQGRRGIIDFRVVCDETNNTPEVVDRNEFVGDIYIKPARSINFVQLNFIATRSSVAFQEVVGRF